jgi:hydroxymethylpyrimidine/phosphomethylpyrimidine kinase
MIPIALTIAGSDSSGGAGIEADLKTFGVFGVHGTVAITAITAQNTQGVFAVQDIDLPIIEKQIDVIFGDLGINSAKTGMLHKAKIIDLVAKKVNDYKFPLVVDPVMVAKSGARLLQEDAVDALKKVLLPNAFVVTPNAMEAEVLAGIEVKTVEDMKNAARKIHELGVKIVVVKGGHVGPESEAVDIIYANGNFKEIRSKRYNQKNTHGTGCGFSAAITANLAKGKDIFEAIEEAKKFITVAIRYGLSVGKGHGPINPFAYLEIDALKFRIINNLSNAVKILQSNPYVSELIPEVQSNLVEALPKPYINSIEDIAGFPGRITKYKNSIKPSGPPEFGGTLHLGRTILKTMEFDDSIRSAMNIKYSPQNVEICRNLGLTISSFDRSEEPGEVKAKEGETLVWGTEVAIRKAGRVPDIIFDTGEVGKEPMIRVLGYDAVEVARKVLKIAAKN